MEGPSQQILCKAGCGFFGNPNTNELCSVCYKKTDSTSQQPPLLKPTTPKQVFRPLQKVIPEKSAAIKLFESSSPSSEEEKVLNEKKTKKNRCDVCRKKLGLIPIECRCGGMFCGVHRYSDKHDCQFDYHELGRKELEKDNPTVVAEKLNKI